MTYKWKRARNAAGDIYYYINLSESVMLHVWFEKSRWHWIIAGWPSPTAGPAIFRHGYSKTLKEATRQLEEILPPDPEQMVWMNV